MSAESTNPHQFGEILSSLRDTGGFTYDPRKQQMVTEGYSVAAHRSAELTVKDEGGITQSHLEGYIAGSAPIWKQGGRGKNRGQEMIGGWGRTLDLPKVYPATPGGHEKSRRAQILRDEKAGFSIHGMADDPNPWSTRQPDPEEGEHPSIGKMSRGKFPEFAAMVAKNPRQALEQPEVSAWTKGPTVQARVQRKR